LTILRSQCSKKRLERDRARTKLLWVVGSRMESQAMMTPDNAEAIIVFLFYCLAVHVTRQERRKRSSRHPLDDRWAA
jgi:hypothetical protein